MRFLHLSSRDGRIQVIYAKYLEGHSHSQRAKISKAQVLFCWENWFPCGSPDFENAPKLPAWEFLECCVFCESGQAHPYQETEVFWWLAKKGHSQIPKYPSFRYSTHLSSGTRELDTIESRCNLCREPGSASLYRILSLPV